MCKSVCNNRIFTIIQLKHFFLALQASYGRTEELNWNRNRNRMIAQLKPQDESVPYSPGMYQPHLFKKKEKKKSYNTDMNALIDWYPKQNRILVSKLRKTSQTWWQRALTCACRAESGSITIHNTGQVFWLWYYTKLKCKSHKHCICQIEKWNNI